MQAYTGFLYSQIGYNHDQPKQLIVRGAAAALSKNASFHVSLDDKELCTGAMSYWGEVWGSHWWVGDFSDCRQ